MPHIITGASIQILDARLPTHTILEHCRMLARREPRLISSLCVPVVHGVRTLVHWTGIVCWNCHASFGAVGAVIIEAHEALMCAQTVGNEVGTFGSVITVSS